MQQRCIFCENLKNFLKKSFNNDGKNIIRKEQKKKGTVIMKTYYPEGQLSAVRKSGRNFASPSSIADCMQRGEIMESNALVCDSEHNLIVNLKCMQGIIPRDEGAIGIAEGSVRDIALISRVGKPVCFVVTDITKDESGNPVAMLSRRKAQEMCEREYIAKLSVGDIIDAKITHLESFGAFCDIGCGCIALLPIDTISVSRISHPKDRFSCGDSIKAIVKSKENGKITLTYKELLGTWSENVALFRQSETVSGVIRSVEDYGVFVELAPNLAGLAEPHPKAAVGKKASVYIKSILPDKMKVKLIIIDTFDDDSPPPKADYFYEGDHISFWKYSPDECSRNVFTQFE